MHAQLDAVFGAARDAEQLDAVAELFGVRMSVASSLLMPST
jgi:hypothetical protein